MKSVFRQVTTPQVSPKFSVIMNCLNGARFLREAIDSVFNQTFTDWEIIFFDSGSTDGSVDIAASYGSRVRTFTISSPVPLGQARQEAVDRAEGEFLAFLDVDDVWLPLKLEKQYSALTLGDFDICYGGAQFIDEAGRNLYKNLPIHKTGPLFSDLLSHVEGSWCTYVVNRKKLVKKGTQFNPKLRSSSEEDMILSFLAYDGVGLVLNEVLAKYRVVGGSVTSRYSDRLAFERFETLSRLSRECPDIRSKFRRSFDQAEARGQYYSARYLMDSGNAVDARRALQTATRLDRSYIYLLLLSRIPLVWRLLHHFKGYFAPIWLSNSRR